MVNSEAISGVLLFILEFVLLIAFVLVLAAGFAYVIESKSCEAQATVMNIPYQYEFWSGCLYMTSDGKWISKERYNSFIKG